GDQAFGLGDPSCFRHRLLKTLGRRRRGSAEINIGVSDRLGDRDFRVLVPAMLARRTADLAPAWRYGVILDHIFGVAGGAGQDHLGWEPPESVNVDKQQCSSLGKAGRAVPQLSWGQGSGV